MKNLTEGITAAIDLQVNYRILDVRAQDQIFSRILRSYLCMTILVDLEDGCTHSTSSH